MKGVFHFVGENFSMKGMKCRERRAINADVVDYLENHLTLVRI